MQSLADGGAGSSGQTPAFTIPAEHVHLMQKWLNN